MALFWFSDRVCLTLLFLFESTIVIFFLLCAFRLKSSHGWTTLSGFGRGNLMQICFSISCHSNHIRSTQGPSIFAATLLCKICAYTRTHPDVPDSFGYNLGFSPSCCKSHTHSVETVSKVLKLISVVCMGHSPLSRCWPAVASNVITGEMPMPHCGLKINHASPG